jgi:hypothetical protein
MQQELRKWQEEQRREARRWQEEQKRSAHGWQEAMPWSDRKWQIATTFIGPILAVVLSAIAYFLGLSGKPPLQQEPARQNLPARQGEILTNRIGIYRLS